MSVTKPVDATFCPPSCVEIHSLTPSLLLSQKGGALFETRCIMIILPMPSGCRVQVPVNFGQPWTKCLLSLESL